MMHTDELRDLYRALNIVKMMEFRRLRWAGHIDRAGETLNSYILLMAIALENGHFDERGNGKIALR
jgi:hypothetical protein